MATYDTRRANESKAPQKVVPRRPLYIARRTSSSLPLVQAKLVLGGAHDRLEREADRVAERVVTTRDGAGVELSRVAAATVQRSCAACQQEEEDGPTLVQRKAEPAVGGGAMDVSPLGPRFSASVLAAKSGGRPLAPDVRLSMESGFRHDFSRVRIHDDSGSAALARQINARAFTAGRDVFFARGEFAPAGLAGKKLLAHELAHVIQQGEGRTAENVVRRALPQESGGVNVEQIALQLAQAVLGSSDPLTFVSLATAALRDITPEQRRKLAALFFRLVPSSMLRSLSASKPGHAIIQYMASFVEQADMDEDLRQTLGEYGRLSSEQVEGITELPAADNCMANLHGNIGVLCGQDAASEMSEPLTSKNLNHLTDRGGAVPLGHFMVDTTECVAKVKFDEKMFENGSSNPYGLKKGKDWNTLKWAPMNPEGAMLHAVRHANPGTYAFGLSLNQWHTVTVILKKIVTGPLQFGTGYELYWNDQNVKKSGALGELIRAKGLNGRLFTTFNNPRFTDPRDFTSKVENEGGQVLPLGEWAARWQRGTLSETDKKTARKKFQGIRCQTHGVMIWQLFPTPPGG